MNTDSDYYEYVRERGQESIVALLLQSYFDVATLLWMQHDQTIQDTITDFALIKGKFFLDMYLCTIQDRDLLDFESEDLTHD